MGGCLFIASLSAYVFARMEFPGRKILFAMVIALMMVPGILTLVPSYSIYRSLGLLDSLTVLILPIVIGGSIFGVFLLNAFFKSLPKDIFEAARIDGCNSWQCFSRIILPLTLPGIASTSIYAFITSWNEYMFAFILTSRPEMKTLSVGIAEMNGFQQIRWNDMMAASLMASLPLILLFICLQKYFVSGLTSGAVKS